MGWAIRHSQLDQLAALLKERGVPCADPIAGSRVRPDGQTLRWRTLTLTDDRKGNLPFFIEWDSTSPHPSTDAPGGCLLQEFRPTGPLPEIPPPQDGMRLHLVPGQAVSASSKNRGTEWRFPVGFDSRSVRALGSERVAGPLAASSVVLPHPLHMLYFEVCPTPRKWRGAVCTLEV